MSRLLLINVWLSFLFNPAASMETQQHAICSAFSISANEYVDTGFSLNKIASDNRRVSASQLQTAIVDASETFATDKASRSSLDTTKVVEYVKSLILFVIPGVIVLVFCFIGFIPILVTRCIIPKKCCPPKKIVPAPEGDASLPKQERVGYSRCKKASPVISYAVLALITLAFVVVGIASAGTILQSMTDSMCSLEILVGDLNVFMTDLAGVIKNVSYHGVSLLDQVATKVDITDDLSARVDKVVDNMPTLIDWLSNQTYIGANGASVVYDLSGIINAKNSIMSVKSSAMQELAASQQLVLDKLVQPRAFITNLLHLTAMATNSTAKMLTQANDLLQQEPIKLTQIPFLLPENEYKGVMGVMGALRGSNQVVGAAFFALVVVTIPFSAMGILILRCKCKAANCCGLCATRFGCTFLFVAMTLLAILGLVLLPISIVFNDVCILMDTLPKDVRVYAQPFLQSAPGSGSVSNSSNGVNPSTLVDLSMETGLQVVDACWADKSLMDALNLTDVMENYVSKVDFSALDDLPLDPNAMFKDFYKFKEVVSALTPEKFGLNMSTIEALERVCNNCTGFSVLPKLAPDAVPKNTNTSALEMCDGKCDDMSHYPIIDLGGGFTTAYATGEMYGQCRTIRNLTCGISRSVREGYEHIVALRKEALRRYDAQVALVADLSDHIVNLYKDLESTRAEFAPFAASVSGIGKYTKCNFVVQFFERTHSALCGSPSTLSGFLWFAMSLAMVPLLSMGMVVSTMYINMRLGGVGQADHDHLRDIRDQTKNTVTKSISRIQTRFSRNQGSKYGRTVKVAPVPERDVAARTEGTARTMQQLRDKHKSYKEIKFIM